MTEAAGAAIRVTGTAHGLSKLVRDKSPAELKELNGRKLAQMGVGEGTAAMFLEHPHYSPTKKTVIVHMLESMQGVAGRETFVRQAAQVRDEPMAFFMQEQVKNMAGYHRRVARVASIIQLRGLAFMQRRDGVLVGVFPVDHLAWRASAAKTVAGLEQEIARISGVTGKEVWVTGTMSPLYRKNIRARKWIVHEQARDKLRMQ